MDYRNQLTEIDEQIAALKEKRKKMFFNGSLFFGPLCSSVCKNTPKSNEVVDAIGKVLRAAYGFPSLRTDTMPKDLGERLLGVVEAISGILIENMDLSAYEDYELEKSGIQWGDKIVYTDGVDTELYKIQAISVRAYNILHRAGITTIRGLLQTTEEYIYSLRNCGPATASEIFSLRRHFAEKFGDDVEVFR